MRNFFVFSISVILLVGCSKNNSFRIEGNFRGSKQKYIYIDRIDVDTPVRIDSAKIKKNGNFKFKIKSSEPDFYQLGFSSSDYITLLSEPGERIKLNFEGKNLFDNYNVTGSAGSRQIKMLDQKLAETKRKIDSLKTVYEAAIKNPGFKDRERILDEEFLNLIKGQRKNNIEFILKNLKSFASIKALYQKIDENTYVLYDPHDLQFLKLVSDTLLHYYPNSKHVKALKKNFEKEMSQMYFNQIEQLAKKIPETKLDPNLIDIKGKRIALSSLRGKYVLLTFWSVTSENCIAENLELKELYKKYNKNGFEIYQINLDENEENWKHAVKYDELPWISVREDDPLNPRNATFYNVKSLPTNYLYNKNGEIIGSNLHGKSLQIKLTQLFGN
jgi:thiol-disulfide isomerase/thioredoxin